MATSLTDIFILLPFWSQGCYFTYAAGHNRSCWVLNRAGSSPTLLKASVLPWSCKPSADKGGINAADLITITQDLIQKVVLCKIGSISLWSCKVQLLQALAARCWGSCWWCPKSMGNFGVLEEPELAEAVKVQTMQGSLRAQALYYTEFPVFFSKSIM